MDGFLVYRFKQYNPPELSGITQVSSLRIMPKAIWKLPKIIRKHKIQVIHAQGQLFPISWISTLLNKLIFKRPMFITVQGRLEVGISSIIENIFDRLITKLIYEKFLKKIICVSDSLKDRLIRLKIKKDKLITIPNGVDVSQFVKNPNSTFLNNYIRNKKDYKKVVFVGRLDVQKGVEYLIRAIPNIISNYTKVHFFILGNGNLELKLKNLVKELKVQNFVTFIDFIPLEKMPEFYSSADIFCLPSIHEGFPLTIAESLSMGLIIVATAIEGVPEAIVEGKNGFLVKPKDTKDLANKLTKALNLSNEEIKKIQTNNINLSKSKYSWEKIVKDIENLYKKNA
jgi:glycosyltransferase involved in cell wall biosynthesis